MIDWLTATLRYTGPDICGGRVITIDKNGEVTFEQLKFLEVVGSWCDRIMVKSVPRKCSDGSFEPGGLMISGNPAKFLQGHNLFGSRKIFPVMTRFLSEVLDSLGILNDETLPVLSGRFTISRLDLTENFSLGTQDDCYRWIDAAGKYATGRVQRFEFKKTTIYLGKHSRRKTLKIYYKYDELLQHRQLPFDPQINDLLLDWAKNKLRFELTFRGMKLKDMGLKSGYQWKGVDEMAIFNTEMAAVKFPDTFVLSTGEEFLLPKKYRLIYDAWRRGVDIQNMVSSASWYRYRKYFFDSWGINIAAPSPTAKTVVVPLMEILRAKPAEIPDWAYDYELVA